MRPRLPRFARRHPWRAAAGATIAYVTFAAVPTVSRPQLASAGTQGIPSQGVLAQAKHTAAYNVEGLHRRGPEDNVIIDNKPLQEMYHPTRRSRRRRPSALGRRRHRVDHQPGRVQGPAR